MTAEPAVGFTIRSADSIAFARLSGDFNPLHVDDLAARRLPFGGSVCHGVDMVLRVLDGLARDGALRGCSLQEVSAIFNQPVRTGTNVELDVIRGSTSSRIKVSGLVNGRAHFSVLVTLGPGAAAPAVAEADPEPHAIARTANFPADIAEQQALSGVVPLRMNAALFEQLFPGLATWLEGRAVTADLAATTRIVGMCCPGLHSIYGEFKLQRRAQPSTMATMPYSVARADPRFQKVRVTLQGTLLEGRLDAFFRTPPVAQRALSEVMATTRPGCVAGQRALVVGGSRGLGELAAKMLLAGGADVTITYARGRADAGRTVAEAIEHGAVCKALPLDASTPLPAETTASLAQAGFTHVYHFATPAIGRSAGSSWNQALFESYCRIYVTGLAEVARATAAGRRDDRPLHIFYPSTVFLDTPEKGFAEYCAAKAAGEALCDQLGSDPRHFAVQRPRLPRMKTDQSSTLLGPEADDPYPVMAGVLQAFCGWQAAA